MLHTHIKRARNFSRFDVYCACNSVTVRLVVLSYLLALSNQRAKYEFASSDNTRPTFAFDTCVFCMETKVPSGRTKRLFHRKSIATIDAIEHVFNVANSNLAYS
jgi:hypothetical protein